MATRIVVFACADSAGYVKVAGFRASSIHDEQVAWTAAEVIEGIVSIDCAETSIK